MSKRSNARPMSAKPKPVTAADQESVITVSQRKVNDTDSDVEEEDEWTAIQKFNAILHYEERKAAAVRDAERKRLLKIELEAQKREKLEKAKKLKEEEMQYFHAQT